MTVTYASNWVRYRKRPLDSLDAKQAKDAFDNRRLLTVVVVALRSTGGIHHI